MTFAIADRGVGLEHEPFIVAELSGNHNQSLDRALALVQAAADAGAHAVKLQTYTADTMTLDCDEGHFVIRDPKSLWHGRRLYDLYAEAHTPWEWHAPIFEKARNLGLIPFSAPFDETAVRFLETLNVPCYKIASFEITDQPLLRCVGATGKPVIVSTGMASLAEIEAAVAVLRQAGCRDILLLKCTSTYPASPLESNLRTIPHLRALFGCEVGLSDHTMGTGVSVAAVAFGASLIEKHFTLRRADGGVDSAFSLEPEELRALVEESRRAWQSLGGVVFGGTEGEQKSKQFRRSLHASRDIAAGEALGPHNVRIVRPGSGLEPKHYDAVVGRLARVPIRFGTPLVWDLLQAREPE